MNDSARVKLKRKSTSSTSFIAGAICTSSWFRSSFLRADGRTSSGKILASNGSSQAKPENIEINEH